MLKVTLSKKPIVAQKSDCLLVFIPSLKKAQSPGKPLAPIDRALGGLIGEVCRRGDFSGKAGQTLCLHHQTFPHRRALLVGVGDDDEDAVLGIDQAFARLAQLSVKSAVAMMTNLSPERVTNAIIAAERENYLFHLGGHQPKKTAGLTQLTIVPPAGFGASALNLAVATARGVQFTRHLAEQPGNVCTPAFLVGCAKQLAKQGGLRAKILDEKMMRKQGMGALLAVAQGSPQSPYLISLSYSGGAAKEKPVVLVGKGVTFDTGGISIKPSGAMDEMKFDMCGAATVFGVMLALSLAKPPVNVVGVIPTVENMPDGKAVKPGDIVTSLSGKTIEILNTDAEGRLILADALAYAERQFKPKRIIDMATLTGACLVALGRHTTGLMGRGDRFLAELQAAGDATADPCWRLPLGKKYQKQLKSDYADMANIGGRYAGTITAACFLSRFVNCPDWAHLDIAGTAWSAKKRATGRPVPMLMRYLTGKPK